MRRQELLRMRAESVGNVKCMYYHLKYIRSFISLFALISRPNGVRFVAPAGTTEFAKRFNPQPGDIVTFKHRGYMLSSNKPKVPTLYRIREDLTWENVVQNWKERAVVTPRGMSKHIPSIFVH